MKKYIHFPRIKKKENLIERLDATINSIGMIGADEEVKFPDDFSPISASDIDASNHYVLLGANATSTTLSNHTANISSLQTKILNGFDVKTLTGGDGIDVKNTSGNWTITATGGGGGGLTEVAHDDTLTGKGTSSSKLGIDPTVFTVRKLTQGTNITISEVGSAGSGNWKIDASGEIASAKWGGISGTITDQKDLVSYTFPISKNNTKGNFTFKYNNAIDNTGSDAGLDWWHYPTGKAETQPTAAVDLRYHLRSGKTDDSFARLRIRDGWYSTDATPVYGYNERFFDALPFGTDNRQVPSWNDFSGDDFVIKNNQIKTIHQAKWGSITGNVSDQKDLIDYMGDFLMSEKSYYGVTGDVYSEALIYLGDKTSTHNNDYGANQKITLTTGVKSTSTANSAVTMEGKASGYAGFFAYTGDPFTGTIKRELNATAISSSTTTYVPSVGDFDLTNSFTITDGKIAIKAGGDVVNHDATLAGTGTTTSPLGINYDKTVITAALKATDTWGVRAITAGSNISVTHDTTGNWTITGKDDPGQTVYWGNMANDPSGTYKDIRDQSDLMKYLWGGTLPTTIPAPPAAGVIGYLASVVGSNYSITKNTTKGTAALYLSKGDTEIEKDGLLRMIIQNDNSSVRESMIHFGQIMKDASNATTYFSIKSYKADGTTVNLERKIDAYPISVSSTSNIVSLGDFDLTDSFTVTNNKIVLKNTTDTAVPLSFTADTDHPYKWLFNDKTNKYIWSIESTNNKNKLFIHAASTANAYEIQVQGDKSRYLSGANISAMADNIAIAPSDFNPSDFTIATNKLCIDSNAWKVKTLKAGTNITLTPNGGEWTIAAADSLSIDDFSKNFTGKGTKTEPIELAQAIKVASTDGKVFWSINNDATKTDYGLIVSKDVTATTGGELIFENDSSAGSLAWGEITGNVKDQKDLCQLMLEVPADTQGKGTADPAHFISELEAGTGLNFVLIDVPDDISKQGLKHGKKLTISVDSSVKASIYTDTNVFTGDGSTEDKKLALKMPLKLPDTAVIQIG